MQSTKVNLSVEESLKLSAEQSYWDGFSDGVRSATDHIKQMRLQEIVASRKANPPAQQEPTNDA